MSDPNETKSVPETPNEKMPETPQAQEMISVKSEGAKPEKTQTLREAMIEALKCCEVWGVVVVVKQSDTTITLDSEAFVDVLNPRKPGDGFEQEVILITSEELHDAYHKTFKKVSKPTESQIEQWLQTVMKTLQGRIRAVFK